MTEAEELELLELEAEEAAHKGKAAPAAAVPERAAPDVGVAETLLNSTGKALPGGHLLSNALTALGLSGSRLLPSGSLFGVDFGDSGTPARLTPQAAAELGMPQEAARPGFVDNYRTARDRLAERTAAGSEQNPWASGIGTGIGTALSLAAPLPKATVGSGATGRILSNALTAGGYGALNGALNSRGDLTRGDVGQVLKDTVGVEGLQRAAEDWKAGHKGRAVLDVMGAGGVGGALTGGVLGAGAEVARRPLQAALQYASNGLDRFAGRKALNALGAMKPEFNELTQEQAQRLGKYALDEGIVTPLASRQTMADRIVAAKRVAGPETTGALAEINAQALPSERILSAEAAAQKAEALADEVSQQPALGAVADKFRKEAQRMRASAAAGQSPGGMSLQDFEENIVRPYKKTAKWGADLPLAQKELQQLPRALERQLEEAAAPIAQRTGSGALANYQEAKGDYGALAGLGKIAKEGLRRQESRKPIGLMDAMAALTGFQHGHSAPSAIAQAAGGLLLSKAMGRFGDQMMATGARGTANALRAAPDLTPNLARALSSGNTSRLAPAEQLRLLQYAQALREDSNL